MVIDISYDSFAAKKSDEIFFFFLICFIYKNKIIPESFVQQFGMAAGNKPNS